jgi:hypothetical protein
MGIMDEINVAVKYQCEKRANWFTDTLIVKPLTALYRKQNNAVKPKPAPAQRPSPAPAGSSENLISQAQRASDVYRPGSLARTRFFSGGKMVAK